MMTSCCMRWTFLVLLWTVVQSDDALKNHRLEKRKDDSFLFFGGWRPVRQLVKSASSSPSSYLQTSATTRYHDILSALPYSFDASSSYYQHALPTRMRYQKDIYNYYPRPAIKSPPKKNTPIYMERYRPQQPKKQQQQQNYGGQSGAQFVDLQSIDLNQIQELHELILQAKHLPLSNINLGGDGGKPLEIIEVSLQGGQKYGGGRGSGRYNRNRNSQRGKGYKRPQQSRAPVKKQQPVQFEYVAFPKGTPLLPQVHPKEIEIGPIKLPHGVSGIHDIVDLKNVQIVEVPIPGVAPLENPRNNKGKGSSYAPYASGTRSSSKQQYKSPVAEAPKSAPFSFSYYTKQFEKPQKQQQQYSVQQPQQQYSVQQPQQQYSAQPHQQYSVQQPQQQYSVQQPQSNQIHFQQNLEAELIKLDEDTLKNLLSNLQVLEKTPHELLKYLPIHNLENIKDDNVQLVLQLPEGGGHNQESNGPAYEVHQSGNQGSYGNEGQYGGGKHQSSSGYGSKGSTNVKVSSDGYHKEVQTSYQNEGGYETESYSPRANGGQYESNQYHEEQSGYEKQSNYQEENQQSPENHYQDDQQQQQYGGQQQSSEGDAREHQKESYSQGEQPYIQVVSPHSDREPVLALELHHGQSVEDALKSLDPEILQKIGAHSKNGIEIEVVEVPIDDYVSSESKKTETVVSASNSTVVPPKTKRTLKIHKS